jgi:hypothetical protein
MIKEITIPPTKALFFVLYKFHEYSIKTKILKNKSQNKKSNNKNILSDNVLYIQDKYKYVILFLLFLLFFFSRNTVAGTNFPLFYKGCRGKKKTVPAVPAKKYITWETVF